MTRPPSRRPDGAAWGLALLSASPVAAQPAPLCGITAPNVAGYHAAVAADPRFKRDGGDARQEIWSAESIQAIWTFVTPAHSAYPAAVCQQVVDRGGAMQIDRQVRCEGTASACAALDKADDGSGDGE